MALDAYRRLRREAAARGAQAHVLDLDDDLRGQSCTPLTQDRADWLLAALDGHFGALQAGAAFFWQDAGQDREALRRRYAALRRQAEAFQLPNLEEPGA